MADSTNAELDNDIELLNRSKTEEILKKKTNQKLFSFWRKRALKTFNAAWQKSKAKVMWSIIKVAIKIVMVFSFSVVLCTMDTKSDFALADKYFKFVLLSFIQNISLHFSTFL